MKESSFIDQNKKKWAEFETLLRSSDTPPSRLGRLFVEITEDLSFSRTFFKNRSVRLYLNGIAQLVFAMVYKRTKGKRAQVQQYWKIELPQMIYEARKMLLVSLVLFLVSIGIGILSSVYEPAFCRAILGDRYVEMTQENINSGDPMAVYKSANQVDMFLGITVNNIRVALMAFVFGIFFSIGTYFMIMYNGIMVGTFLYYFIERGLFRESFITIMQHGTLELSAIVVAGAAGFMLGKGLINPGTYSRLQAFRISSRAGLSLFISTVPIFIIAGFIEGFVTRLTDLNDVIRILVMLASLSLIIYYYVVYPQKVVGLHGRKKESDQSISPRIFDTLDFQKQKSDKEIFGMTYTSFFKNFEKYIIAILFLGGAFAVYSYAYVKFIDQRPADYYSIKDWFDYSENVGAFAMNTFNLTIVISIVFVRLYFWKQKNKWSHTPIAKTFSKFSMIVIPAFISSAVLNLPFFLPIGLAIVLFLLLLPYMVNFAFYSIIENEKGNFFTLMGAANRNMKYTWGKLWSVYLRFLLLAVFIFALFMNIITWQWVEIFLMNFEFESDTFKDMLILVLKAVFMISSLCVGVGMLVNGISLCYFSAKETHSAEELLSRISRMGTKKKVKGFEREG